VSFLKEGATWVRDLVLWGFIFHLQQRRLLICVRHHFYHKLVAFIWGLRARSDDGALLRKLQPERGTLQPESLADLQRKELDLARFCVELIVVSWSSISSISLVFGGTFSHIYYSAICIPYLLYYCMEISHL